MASKPKSATPANGNTASDVKRNTIDPDVIKQDVLSALHSMLENDTSNVKLNQRIAWDIMRWRDQLVANDVKPADFANMIGSPSATAAWKKQVALFFLGKPPSMSKKITITQEVKDARMLYRNRKSILDTAAVFCIVAHKHGMTTDSYDQTASCFNVPPRMIIPVTMDWEGMYALGKAVRENKTIPLDNRSYTVMALDKHGEQATLDIRASVKQVLAVYAQKPGSGLVTDDTSGNDSEGEAGSFTKETIDAVLKVQTSGRMAIGLRAAIERDLKDSKDIPLKLEDYEPAEQEAIVYLTRLFNRLISEPATKAAA